jgi:beta-galactosidase GanA
MQIDETSKNKILNNKNFQFFKNTLIFGDANHDIEMGRDMGNKCTLGVAFLRES